jgi:cytochrome c oxidase assembly protein subunit 15
MLLLIVVIGGVTRLTESGLSITEWAPVTGTVPPLSDEAWQRAFTAYQQIPEYQQLNRGMTLAEFKRIYFWEYLHRLWARLIGIVFAVPFAVFLIRGGLPKRLTWRLTTLLLLTGAQGALGWFMVASGLSERTDVSQYRLAAHLGLALAIYTVTVWTAAEVWAGGQADRRTGGQADRRTGGQADRRTGGQAGRRTGGQAGRRTGGQADRGVEGLRTLAGLVVGLVFLTAVAGAFVAGLDAGRIFNTFPFMGGRIIPSGYAFLDPWWRNLFENPPAVQFNHRLLGVLSVVGALVLWAWGRSREVTDRARLLLMLLPLAALLQVGLGIATLLLATPIGLAALHQAGAVLLLTVTVLLYQALRSSTAETA